MPLILGANQLTAGGYEVDNSLRFNSGSNDNLTRTPASATNRKTFTVSFWYKRSVLSTRQTIFSQYAALNNNEWVELRFDDDNKLTFSWYSASVFTTNQLFRDVSAWYHILLAVDTTQATDTNRIKLYVNGSQVTSFSSITYPAQNYDTGYNQASSYHIGDLSLNGNFDLNGYLAEYYSIDGQALTPSDFGEFDSDTNIWKPIPYTGSFGTNGFYLEFKDSSALGDDTSGNGNDFTANNLTSIDQTTDTPTNNFATMNPLDNYYAASTFSNGNCDILTNGSNYSFNTATFALSSGKWYWEAKIGTNTTVNNMFGIADRVATSSTQTVGEFASSYSLLGTGRLYENGSFTNSWGSSYTTGDIMSVALDLDNNRLYFAKNGTWQNSADPTTGTGAVSITAPSSVTSGNGYYFPAFGDFSGSDDTDWLVNFGNPTFTISSGNADADGFGNFEHAVPSGYFALCTKNLAEYA